MLFFRAPRTDLSPEDRESLAKSLFSDFISSRDLAEAVASAQELVVPGFGPVLARVGLQKAFDSLNEGEQTAIAGLIVDLAAAGAVAPADVAAAVDKFVVELEDLYLDMPTAPKVMGGVMGAAGARGLLGLDAVATQAEMAAEATEPRRVFLAAALLAFQEAQGVDKTAAAIKAAGMDLAALLERDAEFEGHLPAGAVFAKEAGLEALL